MNSPIFQAFIECLGWTLLHFVWQGIVIAALLTLALRWLRQSPAPRRYLAACLAMLLLMLAPVVTFNSICHEYLPVPISSLEATPPSTPTETQNDPVTLFPKFRLIRVRAATLSSYQEKLAAYLPWLVVVWAAGVAFFSMRLILGWLQIRQLKRTVIFALDENWLRRFAELRRRLAIQRPVRLLQSALVEVPMVIGWLRPMILLPVGCLAGWPPAQLESILAHELAHIRRHDYLVNLLQNFLETMLFYHPAVWWVSERIREERENCCDDLAVEVCGDKLAYARALAALEEWRHAPASLALAASGAPLLPRIQRLAGQPNKTRSAWPLIAILLFLLIAAFEVDLHAHHALAVESAAESFAPAPTAPLAQSSPLKNAAPQSVRTVTTTDQRGDQNAAAAIVPARSEEVQKSAPGPIVAMAANPQISEPLSPASAIELAQNQAPASPPPLAYDWKFTLAQTNLEINIKVRFVELKAGAVKSSKFAWLFQSNLEMPSDLKGWPSPERRDAAFPNKILRQPELKISNSIIHQSSLILNPETAAKTLRELEQNDEFIDTLITPEVTTMMGRQAQLQTAQMTTVVMRMEPTKNGIHYQTEDIPCGPVVEVFPKGVAGEMIDLLTRETCLEFLGYDKPATRRVSTPNGTISGVVPLPRFWLREMASEIQIRDGDTLVLGGVIDKLPKPLSAKPGIAERWLPKNFKPAKPEVTGENNLLVFITPTLINPDGTRLKGK